LNHYRQEGEAFLRRIITGDETWIHHYTLESKHQLNFEVLEHPPYSPDLAPSDYHLFGTQKDALRVCHFASDQEMKEVVHAWLVTEPKTFFSEDIQKLVSHWTKCIAKEGDCVEE
jgi:hypothetical protein